MIQDSQNQWKDRRQDNSYLLLLIMLFFNNMTPTEISISFAPQKSNAEELIGSLASSQNISARETFEVAKEIRQIVGELLQVRQPKTETEHWEVMNEAAMHIKNKSSLRTRILSMCKAGGIEAVKEFFDHPAVNILLAMINDWKETE
jgi:hypothetical protein